MKHRPMPASTIVPSETPSGGSGPPLPEPRPVRGDGLVSDLLRDPRKLRGDLRLLWTAVRRGDVPDDRKAPLVRRLGEVQNELFRDGGYGGLSQGTRERVLLLLANVMIAMTQADVRIDNRDITRRARELSRRLGGTSDVGRPRTRVRPRR